VPIHLRPTAPTAPDALLPGDPGRALLLAQKLLAEPLMSNHNRGLWGYHGIAADGEPLTVQATGMGGPSAAIVLHELAELGVRRAVRIGTCGALNQELEPGAVLRVPEALSADGASAALGAEGRVKADGELDDSLAAALPDARPALVATVDLFYDPDLERGRGWIEAGAEAVEMEAATMFQAGRRAGVAVGCLLVVTDAPAGGRGRRLDDEALAEASLELGGAALSALRSAARSG
jgi:uridine phosphorylase